VSDPPLEVDIRSPPADLDGRIEWFGRVSDRLVLLEEYPLSDIAFAVDQIAASVQDHLHEVAGNPERRDGVAGPSTGPAAILRADHGLLPVSLEQLRWFYGIVAREDHGGHRQALGQYGKVLAEALQRHREEERERQTGGAEPASGPRTLAEKP